MLSKSKASPYIVTLLRSFVLSDLYLKLTDLLKIKLKMYKRSPNANEGLHKEVKQASRLNQFLHHI